MLEVIAQTVEDAREAEAGGADRIELVRSLALGGLTPAPELVESVLAAVRIPVRVMLRSAPTMTAGTRAEREHLLATASALARLPIDGVVAGFLEGDAVDRKMMLPLAECLHGKPITFHRAFDEIEDTAAALATIRDLPSVDRVLTGGRGTTFAERLRSVIRWQREAGRALTFLFAASLQVGEAQFPRELREVHVGRAARIPADHTGIVHRQRVSVVKQQIA